MNQALPSADGSTQRPQQGAASSSCNLAYPKSPNQKIDTHSGPFVISPSKIRSRRFITRERIWRSPFGVLRVRTYINKFEFVPKKRPGTAAEHPYTLQESEFRFVPSWWASGIQIAASYCNNRNIPTSLRQTFIIPDKSRIFRLCLDTRRDNTANVLEAFKQGWASPFDTNTRGESLLHVRIPRSFVP
jgi:hypothetical protein